MAWVDISQVSCDNKGYLPLLCDMDFWRQYDVLLVAVQTPTGQKCGVVLRKLTGRGIQWVLMRKEEFQTSKDFPQFTDGMYAHELGVRACNTNNDQVALVNVAGLRIEETRVRT